MTPQQQIDARIVKLGDWRGNLYAELRKLINETEPSLEEIWKWDTAVWKINTNVCALGSFKDHIKLNFFKGAALADPEHVFNSGLDSKLQRSINFSKDSLVGLEKIKDLVRQAAALDR